MSRPTPSTQVSQAIVDATEELIEFMDSDDYHEDRVSDYENHVFETVMTEIYGNDMWAWFREKQI